MKSKKPQDEMFDAYIVLIPHGVKFRNYPDICCPDDECFLISSHKNQDKIQLLEQGTNLFVGKVNDKEKP